MEELLDGFDLVLLGPDLSSGRRDALLGSIRSAPKTQTIPVLILSRNTGEVPDDEAGIVVPWPSGIESLSREIEAALKAAT